MQYKNTQITHSDIQSAYYFKISIEEMSPGGPVVTGFTDTEVLIFGPVLVEDLDEERKAAMVSNLLVVLCGDEPAQPVVNSGSLY